MHQVTRLLLRGYPGNFSGFRAAYTAPAANGNKQQPTWGIEH